MPPKNDVAGRDIAFDQCLERRIGILLHMRLGGDPGAHAESAVVKAQHAEAELPEALAVPELLG